MAVVLMDSLATYTSKADLEAAGFVIYNSDYVTFLPTGGEEGQPCIKITASSIDEAEDVGNDDSYGEFAIPWTHQVDANFVCFRLKVDSLQNGTGNENIVCFNTAFGGNYYNLALWIDEDGQLYVKTQSPVKEWYTGFIVPLGSWISISFKGDAQNSPNGLFDLVINGRSYVSESGIDTYYSGTSGQHDFRWGCNQNNSYQPEGLDFSISDIYILDDLGGALDDHLSPDTRVSYVPPDAEGATINFTPSAGTDNSLMIDEVIGHDFDTTRNVSDGTLTHKDTFSMAAIPIEPSRGEIYAIKPIIVAKKSDATARTIKAIQKGTAEGLSAAITLTETYDKYDDELFLLHPDTSLAWTKAQFAAGEFGYGNDT